MDVRESLQIFNELCDLADGESDDELPKRVQQLQAQGIELKVETNLDEPEFITAPTPTPKSSSTVNF